MRLGNDSAHSWLAEVMFESKHEREALVIFSVLKYHKYSLPRIMFFFLGCKGRTSVPPCKIWYDIESNVGSPNADPGNLAAS